MSGLAILILAAGRSTRMRGADKLLEPVGGQPVLRHLANEALRLGPPVYVTLPPGDIARRAALAGLAIEIVELTNPKAGMAESLAAGIGALPPGITGAMLVLGDMPEVTSEDMMALIGAQAEAGGTDVFRGCTADGSPGHPVIFPARLFEDLTRLTGDSGARELLGAEQVRLVPLPGQHAVLDLDTPEDWNRWRARQR